MTAYGVVEWTDPELEQPCRLVRVYATRAEAEAAAVALRESGPDHGAVGVVTLSRESVQQAG